MVGGLDSRAYPGAEGTRDGVGDLKGVPEKPKHGPLSSLSRNAALERALPELRAPHARKTGTTIAGLVFRVSLGLGSGGLARRAGMRRPSANSLLSPSQDGVILGADTRATNDSVVADKNCEKIHFIAPKI